MTAVLTTMSWWCAMAMRQSCWMTRPTTLCTSESGSSIRTFLTCPSRPTSRLVGMSSPGPSVSSVTANWPGGGGGRAGEGEGRGEGEGERGGGEGKGRGRGVHEGEGRDERARGEGCTY